EKGDDPKHGAAPGKKAPAAPGGLAGWLARTKSLPVDRQAGAVAGKLREVNPGFDGKSESKVKDGAVISLGLNADRLVDLLPLQALLRLEVLACNGSKPGASKLADLSALRGLPLEQLGASNTQVADLSPLRGAPLVSLSLSGAPVEDLSPLAG